MKQSQLSVLGAGYMVVPKTDTPHVHVRLSRGFYFLLVNDCSSFSFFIVLCLIDVGCVLHLLLLLFIYILVILILHFLNLCCLCYLCSHVHAFIYMFCPFIEVMSNLKIGCYNVKLYHIQC